MTDGIPGALRAIGKQNPHLAMAMEVAADEHERLAAIEAEARLLTEWWFRADSEEDQQDTKRFERLRSLMSDSEAIE